MENKNADEIRYIYTNLSQHGKQYLLNVAQRIKAADQADPEELRTPARHIWKSLITERVSRIRRISGKEDVRKDYRIMFSRIYASMEDTYGIDMKKEKEIYMEKRGIPMECWGRVKTLNVVYANPLIREALRQTLIDYERFLGVPVTVSRVELEEYVETDSE